MASGSERQAQRSPAQWQTLIEGGQRSPLVIAAFRRAEGVSTASFYNWRKRLSELAPNDGSAPAAAPAPAFLDLGALGAADGEAVCWDIELALGDGVVMRLRHT